MLLVRASAAGCVRCGLPPSDARPASYGWRDSRICPLGGCVQMHLPPPAPLVRGVLLERGGPELPFLWARRGRVMTASVRSVLRLLTASCLRLGPMAAARVISPAATLCAALASLPFVAGPTTGARSAAPAALLVLPCGCDWLVPRSRAAAPVI